MKAATLASWRCSPSSQTSARAGGKAVRAVQFQLVNELGRLPLLCGRLQRDSGLGCEQQERQRLLKVEAYDAVGVTQIADRNVLPDVQVEIALTPRSSCTTRFQRKTAT